MPPASFVSVGSGAGGRRHRPRPERVGGTSACRERSCSESSLAVRAAAQSRCPSRRGSERVRTWLIAIMVVIADRGVASEPPGRFVHYERDRLTVHVENTPLREVLAAVAEAGGADVRGDAEGADRSITVAIDDLPVQEALERLLERQPFLLRYDRISRLQRIVLFERSRGIGASGQPNAPVTTALAST